MSALELVAAEYEAHAALDEATDTDVFAFEWPDLYWYANAAIRARDDVAQQASKL